jgi:hypothetical protein
MYSFITNIDVKMDYYSMTYNLYIAFLMHLMVLFILSIDKLFRNQCIKIILYDCHNLNIYIFIYILY